MKVLFIGNSYTYCNDLPGFFVRLCEEHGIKAEADMVAAGGYTLAHYVSGANDPARELRRLIAEKDYDFAVFQEQSVYPAASPATFFKSLSELIAIVCAKGAKPVLYETWGRRDGVELLDSLGWTHDRMQELLLESYSKAAKDNGCLLALAGEAFHRAYREGKEVFAPDGSHPSPEGTLIAATEIFKAITGTSG